MADEALTLLDPVFGAMYAKVERPSIQPERLLKAQLLIGLYSVQSDRQFCERLDYDLLFRFFLDMGLDEMPWDPSIFAKNRNRLIEDGVAVKFFEDVIRACESARLISLEHFTINGPLIEAWAKLEGFWRTVEKRERSGSEEARAVSPVELRTDLFPETPDVIAWNKARTRYTLELLAAIASGVLLIAMFAVFCFILMK